MIGLFWPGLDSMACRAAVFGVLFASVLIWNPHQAQAAILYDASLGTTPDQQAWTLLSNPLLTPVTHGVEQNTLVLDTLDVLTQQAGYFSTFPLFSRAHPDVPTVDLQSSEFVVDFTLRLVIAQDLPDDDARHVGQRNRGGFAVIAISEQLTGVELHFQSHRILGLSNLDTAFPIGEMAAFNTTDALTPYRLTLADEEYRLAAGDTVVLTGPLRNYSNIAPSPPFDFPYTTPSFFFFGDDTPRAGAITEVTRFAVAPLGDCSHDGLRNHQDFACFSTIEERDATLGSLGTLPGDLDGDGNVAFADFLILSTHFGNLDRNYAQGNIDLSGGVDFADFLILSANFGQQSNRLASLPEPSRKCSLTVGLLVLLSCWRIRLRQKYPAAARAC